MTLSMVMKRPIRTGSAQHPPRALAARGASLVLVVASSFAAATSTSQPGAPQAILNRVADIPLGGDTTRLDYESLDPGRHLLFIAHLGNSTVIVFDTEAQRVITRIPGISKVHGVLAIPELGRVYASATGTNEVVAIDEGTLKVTARAPAGVYPDGMAYAPEVHKLYVSDEHGNTETVIDVRTNTRVATIPLGGGVGNTQYDPESKHVFVNVQTREQLIEIDPESDKVVGRTDLPGAEGNHGLLIEPHERRAFIACEDNHRLLVLDLDKRKVMATFEVGEDPDVLAYDPGLHYVYVAAESGSVSVFKTEPGQVSKVGDVQVGPNAHVVAVDPGDHKSYFPLKNWGGQTALRIMSPGSEIGP
jgi:YVTN family beta-propeller protein